MPDGDYKKLGGAYQRALETWAKEIGPLTIDLEGLKKQLDALDPKKDAPQVKTLKVDWDAITKKLDGQCDLLCRNIKGLPKVEKSEDGQALKDLQKQMPAWMRKTIERVSRGGVPIPYPDVTLDGGAIKVTGVKIWLKN